MLRTGPCVLSSFQRTVGLEKTLLNESVPDESTNGRGAWASRSSRAQKALS